MEYAPFPTASQLTRLADSLSSGSALYYLRRFEGGLSCTIDQIEQLKTSGQRRILILRRYSPWADGGNLTREVAALSIAATGNVLVPELVWIDTNDIFSERAIVTTDMNGEAMTQPSGIDTWPEQLAIAATQIHAIPLSKEGAKALGNLESFAERCVSETEPPEEFLVHPLGIKLWERRQELFETIGTGKSRFVHADYWPGNTLWRDGRLVAVIDWEDAGFGDPMVDVADCATDLRFIGQDDMADRFIDKYADESGNDMKSLPLWNIIAQTHPFPDIAKWLPSFHAMGWPNMTVGELRARHTKQIERALAETD
jgi:aminoglycoside phosphotransferase (APT) family kinase protein